MTLKNIIFICSLSSLLLFLIASSPLMYSDGCINSKNESRALSVIEKMRSIKNDFLIWYADNYENFKADNYSADISQDYRITARQNKLFIVYNAHDDSKLRKILSRKAKLSGLLNTEGRIYDGTQYVIMPLIELVR